jgi:hypothetical protein
VHLLAGDRTFQKRGSRERISKLGEPGVANSSQIHPHKKASYSSQPRNGRTCTGVHFVQQWAIGVFTLYNLNLVCWSFVMRFVSQIDCGRNTS